MHIRWTIQGLACLLTLLPGIAAVSAAASPLPPGISDLLMIVDDSGQPVKDSLGNSAVRTLSEADIVLGPNSLVIDLGTPTAVLRSPTTTQSILLTEPDSTVSDIISIAIQHVPSETTRVDLCEPPGFCALPLVTLSPTAFTESGEPQDVASFIAPDGTHVHVIVQSAVPEPSTALLVTAGLGCIRAMRQGRMRPEA